MRKKESHELSVLKYKLIELAAAGGSANSNGHNRDCRSSDPQEAGENCRSRWIWGVKDLWLPPMNPATNAMSE
jgi:hypothetical protein